MIEGILEIIPAIFKTISEDITLLLNGKKITSKTKEDELFLKRLDLQSFEYLTGSSLIYISIVLDLI